MFKQQSAINNWKYFNQAIFSYQLNVDRIVKSDFFLNKSKDTICSDVDTQK